MIDIFIFLLVGTINIMDLLIYLYKLHIGTKKKTFHYKIAVK